MIPALAIAAMVIGGTVCLGLIAEDIWYEWRNK